MVTEKEFEIINIIGDGVRSNQREISSKLGFSLGMTNFLLKRLATKGYLRIKQLNRKKVEYLLTPQGISEKASKSYNYMLKTLESIGLIKGRIRTLLNTHMVEGANHLLVCGNGDLADLVELALRDYASRGYEITHQATPPAALHPKSILLNTTAEPLSQNYAHHQCVDLLVLLAQDLQIPHILSKRKAASV